MSITHLCSAREPSHSVDWPVNISVQVKGASHVHPLATSTGCACLGLGMALSAALPALSAAAEPTSVTARLTDSAALLAKGAAVEIPVTYPVCNP